MAFLTLDNLALRLRVRMLLYCFFLAVKCRLGQQIAEHLLGVLWGFGWVRMVCAWLSSDVGITQLSRATARTV